MSESAAKSDMEEVGKVLGSPASAADWVKAESALSHFNGTLALIEDAQSKPAGGFLTNPVIKGTSQEALQEYTASAQKHYQQLHGLRDATRLLCAKALLSAREGRTQDVVRYTRSALNVNNAFGSDSLISYLINVAITNITLANMRQALSYCQLNDTELRQLDDIFSQVNMSDLYRHAIEGERVQFLLQNYEFRRAGMAMPPSSSGDTLAYLDFVSRHLQCINMSYSEALSKRLVGPRAADNIPFYAILTKITAPVLVRTAGARYKNEAEIACGRMFLALKAYKARFGNYPLTLSELKSSMDWKLPTDPFNGKDMKYKRIGSGFVVYSVGYDLKDDNGTALQSQNETDEPRGDIVWKITQ